MKHMEFLYSRVLDDENLICVDDQFLIMHMKDVCPTRRVVNFFFGLGPISRQLLQIKHCSRWPFLGRKSGNYNICKVTKSWCICQQSTAVVIWVPEVCCVFLDPAK